MQESTLKSIIIIISIIIGLFGVFLTYAYIQLKNKNAKLLTTEKFNCPTYMCSEKNSKNTYNAWRTKDILVQSS